MRHDPDIISGICQYYLHNLNKDCRIATRYLMLMSGIEKKLFSGGLLSTGTIAVLAIWNAVDERIKYHDEVVSALARTGDEISAFESKPEEISTVDIDEMIPEFERTAEDILVSIPYPQYGDDTIGFINDLFGPMIDALPDYSKIHFITQDNLDMQEIDQIKHLFPKRNITIYPVFNSEEGPMGYSQDFGEATGAINASGQFEIINHASSFLLKSYAPAGVEVPDNPYFADEILAEKYPDKFETPHIETFFSGGNTSFGRLPNGEKCVFVNKSDMVMFISDKFDIPFNEPVTKEIYEEAKEMYKTAFGTENIIVIDEENFLTKIENEPMKVSGNPGVFFHNDMIFLQKKIGEKNVIFLSDPRLSEEIIQSKLNPDIVDMFDRIDAQFRALGFDVVGIPFANNDLNFVNVISYTDKNTGNPTIVLPTYHFDPEDRDGKYIDEIILNDQIIRAYEQAEEIYRKNGVDVKTASYFRTEQNLAGEMIKSRSFMGSTELQSGVKGGFHCRVQVLR